MTANLRLHDTCGVHNLHGMPALISAIASAIYASMASVGEYQSELQDIFPAMVGTNGTETKIMGVSIRVRLFQRWVLILFGLISHRVLAGMQLHRRATNCSALLSHCLLPLAVVF